LALKESAERPRSKSNRRKREKVLCGPCNTSRGGVGVGEKVDLEVTMQNQWKKYQGGGRIPRRPREDERRRYHQPNKRKRPPTDRSGQLAVRSYRILKAEDLETAGGKRRERPSSVEGSRKDPVEDDKE